MQPFKRLTTALPLLLALCSSSPAWAQLKLNPPRAPAFDPVFAAPVEPSPATLWQGSLALSASGAYGNANALVLGGRADLSRRAPRHHIGLTIDGIYALIFSQELEVPDNFDPRCDAAQDINDVDDDDDQTPVGPCPQVSDNARTTLATLRGALRYDYLFTDRIAFYGQGTAGLDRPASKEVFASGQVGSTYTLYRSSRQELSAEAGLDYGFTRYLTPDPPPTGFVADLHLFSGRVAARYQFDPRKDTRLSASVDALVNLNPAVIGAHAVGAGRATRLNGRLSADVKLWGVLGLRAAVNVRFDAAPGLNTQVRLPLATVLSTNAKIRYNRPLDVLSELALVVSFL